MQRLCKHTTVELMNSAILTMDLLQMSLQVFGLHVRVPGVVVLAVVGTCCWPLPPDIHTIGPRPPARCISRLLNVERMAYYVEECVCMCVGRVKQCVMRCCGATVQQLHHIHFPPF